ncbi:MAG: formylglycine-generating enzyme family protein [Gammaproteobacteria bacterium]|nr:formylglycine-generating enzyme family protein [Gammaproteobacteria bacterium]
MTYLKSRLDQLARAVTIILFALGLSPGQVDAAALAPGPIPELRMESERAPLSAFAGENMITVPAGDYPVGHDNARRDVRPPHRVSLKAFAIDETEVTNGQFAEFLNALDLRVSADFAYSEAKPEHFSDATWPELLEQGIRPDRYPLIGLDDDQVRIEVRSRRFAAARGFENHPVAETTWRGARNYCAWRGARLPTEAEWEASARGLQGRVYPWGDALPDNRLVYARYPTGVTAPVGSRPDGATPEGVLDLSGSLAEWTASLYKPYPYDATDGREDLLAPGERVTRGGDYVFDTDSDQLTGYFRSGFSRAPQSGHRHIGFRCARSLS